MRYCIISDIHGNINALEAVLQEAHKQNIDEYIFLGDYYGDLPYPNEIPMKINELSKQYPVHMIKGNKEDYLIELHTSNKKKWIHKQFHSLYWNYNELSDDHLQFYMNLPNEKTVKYKDFMGKDTSILLVHSIKSRIQNTKFRDFSSSKFAERYDLAPFSHEEYLENIMETIAKDQQLQSDLMGIDENIILCGHSHIQWHATYDDKLIINAGSCGLPLDYDTSAAYTILEVNESNAEENYNVFEQRIQYDRKSLILRTKESSYYDYAKDWCDIVFKQLDTGRDEIFFFFEHANEIALSIGEDRWPLTEFVWTQAIATWREKIDMR